MKSTIKRRAVIVGLFLFFGLVILVAGIMTIGRLHNSFVQKFVITTIFEEVNGLQPGNNIWFSGVKIGTVHKLKFYGKSQVEVSMRIDEAAHNFIRKDAKAKISSDGLIGNKIIVIYGGSDGVGAVAEGDTLKIEKTLSTDDMMNTLQENNKNLLSITGDFKEISKKILNGEGTLGKVLNDDALYNNLGQTVATLNRAAENAEKLTASISAYTSKMNQKGSLTNDIATDTVVFRTLTATIDQLKQIALSAADITAGLKTATAGLNSESSPVGVLLHDQPASADLKATLKNLETGTRKLNEDLDALKENFLFRRYFKKKDQAAKEIK